MLLFFYPGCTGPDQPGARGTGLDAADAQGAVFSGNHLLISVENGGETNFACSAAHGWGSPQALTLEDVQIRQVAGGSEAMLLRAPRAQLELQTQALTLTGPVYGRVRRGTRP